MTVLTKSNILKKINKIKLQKIAVAYIGNDFDKLIQKSIIKQLKQVVISPTEGSNPFAIQRLVNIIGWEKISFLDNLHAKIYIGEKQSILGSANWSKNGLNGKNLYEASVVIDTKKANPIFKDIWQEANKQYPTQRHKSTVLKKLFQTYNKRIRTGFEQTSSQRELKFADFQWLGDNHFYLTWFCGSGGKYTSNFKELYKEGEIADSMAFSERDSIKNNKWILCWECDSDRKPTKKKFLSWIYIDNIISNGWNDGKNSPYTKLAVQLKANSHRKPPEPFKLSSDFQKAFKETIKQKEFRILRNDDPYTATSAQINKILPKFWEAIKQEIKKKDSKQS